MKPEPMTPEQIEQYEEESLAGLDSRGWLMDHTKFANDLLAARDAQWEEMLSKQEPVSAEIRFCQPQKKAVDSGWGPWQQWKVLAKHPARIDSQGYLVDYRLLYAAPVDQQAEIERLKECKQWYDDAMIASNEAGFVGLSAEQTIREQQAVIEQLRGALVSMQKVLARLRYDNNSAMAEEGFHKAMDAARAALGEQKRMNAFEEEAALVAQSKAFMGGH